MNAMVSDLIVRKSIVVDAPAAHVFDVFVQRMDLWWPRSHHIGKSEKFVAILEPRVGGRWYEAGADGTECDWGRVLAWEPPRRVVLSWDINAQWQYDPSIANEVEVRFIADGPERTRVELEHSRIERFGEQAQAMYDTFNSDGGWTGLLKALAETAQRRST